MTTAQRALNQAGREGALRDQDLRVRVFELTNLWGMPTAADTVELRLSERLSRAIGRADLKRARISLAAWLRRDPALLDHALCHELAHIVAFQLVGRSERAHGPTWQRLMREAGYEPTNRLQAPAAPARGNEAKAARRYRHTCPTCQFSRISARRMRAWRCADCVAAGLDGQLQIAPTGRAG